MHRCNLFGIPVASSSFEPENCQVLKNQEDGKDRALLSPEMGLMAKLELSQSCWSFYPEPHLFFPTSMGLTVFFLSNKCCKRGGWLDQVSVCQVMLLWTLLGYNSYRIIMPGGAFAYYFVNMAFSFNSRLAHITLGDIQ